MPSPAPTVIPNRAARGASDDAPLAAMRNPRGGLSLARGSLTHKGALCKKRALVVRDDEGKDAMRARDDEGKDAERARDDIMIENGA